MKVALPRVIYGNRGDLASRWGIINVLQRSAGVEPIVFFDQPGDVPQSLNEVIPYGRIRNLWPTREGRAALRKSEKVLWAAGLDLQDDSSLSKLLYLWVIFVSYRLRGLKIQCVCQGAGPLESRAGRFLARRVLEQVEVFIARDPDTQALLHSVAPDLSIELGHDGIFLEGIEQDLPGEEPAGKNGKRGKRDSGSKGVIGFNIRQWYHFRRSILPYQFSQARYQNRAEGKMRGLIEASLNCIDTLRRDGFEVALLSAYQPGSVPWEDDLPWLKEIYYGLENRGGVHLIDEPLTLPAYFKTMSELVFMIGMRLHSSLIALRLGIPALNLSYTLKGESIYRALDLEDWIIVLEDFIDNPRVVSKKIATMNANKEQVRRQARTATQRAVQENELLLQSIFLQSKDL